MYLQLSTYRSFYPFHFSPYLFKYIYLNPYFALYPHPPAALCWGFAGTQSCPKSLQHPPPFRVMPFSKELCWSRGCAPPAPQPCSVTRLRNHAPQPRRPARATHRRPRLTAALSSSSSQSMQAALAALSSSSS